MKPSAHYRQGECGFCHALGYVVIMVPTEHEEPCPACGGTGKFPPEPES